MAKSKKKLNTKFVGILSGSTLGLAGLVAAAYFIKHRYFAEKPDRYYADGKAALEAKDYARARDLLSKAISLSPPDAALDTAMGDALNGLTSKENDYVAAARQAYERATAIDPNYTPALERIIQFWEDDLDLSIRPNERAQAADYLTKASTNLLDVDPKSVVGRRTKDQAVIELMLDGRSTAPSALNNAEEDLLKLWDEHPDDANLPFWAARSRVRQALDAARSEDSAGTDSNFKLADEIMANAVRQRPTNPDVAYRYSQIILQLAGAAETVSKPPAVVEQYVKRALDEADRAHRLVQPSDSNYIEINLFDAKLQLERPDFTAATVAPGASTPDASKVPSISESPLADSLSDNATQTHQPKQRVETALQIYQQVLANRPNDSFTRLAMAQLLGDLPGRRDEAIAMLNKPLVEDHPLPGLKGTLLPFLQSEADTRLLGLQLDALDATNDPKARGALIAQCTALCDRLLGKSPDSPAALGMQGRLDLAQEKLPEATQTLRRALALIDSKNTQTMRTRYELMYYLAQAYEMAQQTGEATKLASDILAPDAFPNYIPARLMLARLLIQQHDFAGAKESIDFLESKIPTNPNLAVPVQRMRLACVDPDQDPAAFKALYEKLPEATRDQQIDKARIAHVGKLDDDSIRLLKIICAANPGDTTAAESLSGLYAQRNQLDQAKAVIAAAVSAKPNDPTLVATKMRLDGTSQAEIDQKLQEMGLASPDQKAAFDQEMALAADARQRGDNIGLDRHLAVAQKLKPEDPHIWDALFVRDLDTTQWDKAQVLLDKLASNNVDQAGGALYRIRMAIAQNDSTKSMDLAIKLTRDKPEFAQSWCILGDVQRSQGRFEESIDSYNASLLRQVGNMDAMRGMIQSCYALNKPDAAKIYIDKALALNPRNEEFKELALTHELTYGDPQNVITPREDALRRDPSDSRNWLNLASTYATAAQARLIAKDPDGAANYNLKAAQMLKDGIAKFPDDERFPLGFSKMALKTKDIAAADQVMHDFAARPDRAGRPETATVCSDFYDHAGLPDKSIEILRAYLAKPYVPTNIEADVIVQLRLASLLNRLSRPDEALAALATNPNQAGIIRQKIILLINNGRLVEADKALAVEAVKGPLPPDLSNLKGVVQLNEGQQAQAKQTFDSIIVEHPDNVDALVHRASIAMRPPMPNYRSALMDLNHARDLNPQNVDVRLMISQIDRYQNRPADAVKELESAVNKVPNDKRLRLELVDLYASQQNWDDANRVLRDAAMKPELADDVDLLHASAMIAMDKGDLSQAEQLIKQAMAKAPDNVGMIRTYYDLLIKQKASSQLLNSSQALLDAHQNDPSLWWVFPYRAQAQLIDSSNKSAATDELDRGLSLAAAMHDDDATTQLMHRYNDLLGLDAALAETTKRAANNGHWELIAGLICQQKEQMDDAIRWFEEAMKRYDTLSSVDQASVLRHLAYAYVKQDPPDTVKAADMYRRLLVVNPNDVDVMNNLACLLVEPNTPAYQPKEALGYAEQAFNAMTQSGADDAMIKDTYGWTLISNGKVDEGYNLVVESMQKKDFPEGHYHLAEAMLKRTPPDPDDAATELKKALRMLDQNEQAGKPSDPQLKARLNQELKRANGSMAG